MANGRIQKPRLPPRPLGRGVDPRPTDAQSPEAKPTAKSPAANARPNAAPPGPPGAKNAVGAVDAFQTTRTPTPAPASAPAAVPAPAFSTTSSVAQIRHAFALAAGRETARYALRLVAEREGPAQPAAQQLLREGLWREEALPRGVMDLISALEKRIEKLGGREAARSAHTLLQDELVCFRFGKKVERCFSVEPVEVPASPSRANPVAPQTGFTPGVDGLALEGGHSMQDVQNYVEDRLGSFVLEDLIGNQRKVEFHHGGKEDTFASLRARGFEPILRVVTPKSETFNQLFVARSSQSGEVRYAFTEISGADRLAHIQKLVSAARLDGLVGTQRVLDPQVLVFDEPMRSPEEIYRRYSRALLASGTVAPAVVIGFKNGILSELGRRAAGARRLEFLQGALGPDPLATLRARADAAGQKGRPLAAAIDSLGETAAIVRQAPSAVFRFADRLEQFTKVQDALTAALAAHPEIAPLVKDVLGTQGFKVEVKGKVAETIPDASFIDQSVITYVNSDGVHRSLLVTRSPYGDLAHQLGRVLVDNDVKNVFVMGTAGGLKESDRIGDIHVPTASVAADGSVTRFQNAALSVIAHRDRIDTRSSGLHLDSEMVEVNSPLDETKSWLEGVRSKGYDVVEMELADLLRALRDKPVDLFAAYVVSDVPGTAHTLESHASGDMTKSLAELTDALIAKLGMTDVALAGDRQEVPRTAWAGASKLAERVLKSRGISGPDSLLQRYTVSRYLMNGLSDAAIRSLVADEGVDPLASSQLMSRWKAKAQRELTRAYRNEEVIARLQELGRTLGEGVKEIEAIGFAPNDYKLHLLGSIVKGRAGLGSDVDAVLEAHDPVKAKKVYESKYGYAGAPADSPVVLGSYEYAKNKGAAYGPLIDLGNARSLLESPDLLVEVFAKAIRDFGIAVQKRGDKWVVEDAGFTAGSASVPERETEGIAEKILEYEKAYRGFMDTDFLVRHIKEVAPLADVGHLPFARLTASGEALIASRLREALTPERLATHLLTPGGQRLIESARGKAFLAKAGAADAQALASKLRAEGFGSLPWAEVIDGETACELMSATDPLDKLTVDFAICERARLAHEKTGGEVDASFPFFAPEVASVLAERAQAPRPQAGAPREPSPYFDSHAARGSAPLEVGVRTIRYDRGIGRLDTRGLFSNHPVAALISETAREYGVTVGYWGGAARDLLTGRKPSIASDVDLVYDSRQPRFAEFRDAVLERVKRQFGDAAPVVDFSVNLDPAIPMRGPQRGVTIEKLGILDDGSVYDFTGRGLQDLKAGAVHYNAGSDGRPPGISTIFRMVGVLIQHPTLRFDGETEAGVRKVLKEYYGPDSPNVAALRRVPKGATAGLVQRAVGFLVDSLLERAQTGGIKDWLFGPLRNRTRFERKRFGENFFDFSRTLGKIVKGNVQTDPGRALEMLGRYGLVDFLDSIGAHEQLSELEEAARKKANAGVKTPGSR